jgi:predicted nucleic acid-binding protein
MKFWDASAIVPLLVQETSSDPLRALAANDPAMLVWWGSQVECVSALTRRERAGVLTPRGLDTALRGLQQLTGYWDEIEPAQPVREAAQRFLRVHPLRAADALQLAAAYLGAERRPTTLAFVTLDQRLAVAAQKEGFAIVEVAVE